jgi:hypothetical protein
MRGVELLEREGRSERDRETERERESNDERNICIT